ncbi:aminoglycoside phosphotransferase family protein [Glutamicibacter sp. X7]
MAMHENQLRIDERLAARMIADQFPEYRREPIQQIRSDGTVNAIFRIGTEFTARFPLLAENLDLAEAHIARESAALRELAVFSTVPTPEPIALGEPTDDYPMPWSIQTWIPGQVTTPNGVAHSDVFACDLAELITSLRTADVTGRQFSGSGRGGTLADSDEWIEVCFQESQGLIPVDELRQLWASFRRLPRAGKEAMTHGDLIPGNLVVENDRLVGVLDGGGFSPADPALDLVCAWHLLDAERRSLLRQSLICDDLEWRRGAAWAFEQAMGLVWYYRKSNPTMSRLGRSTLTRILNDHEIVESSRRE